MVKRRATLGEIARICRVSTSTVSRSLRDHPLISSETKEAVRKVADSLDYRAISPASALVRGRSNLVAIVHGGVDAFWDEVCHLARRATRSQGFLPVDCVMDEPGEREQEVVDALLAQLVAGILWKPFYDAIIPDVARRMADRGTPLVVLDRFVADSPAIFVHTDDIQGARLAIRHVCAGGKRPRIAILVGPQQSQTMRWRKEGFLSGVDEAGIPRNQVCVQEISFDYQNAYQAAREALVRPDRPTAIVTARDEDAWGALDAARDLQIRVPEDLRIIGYGDYLPRHYTRCGLTTVRQDRERLVRIAVSALMEAMSGEYHPRNEARVLPVKLVVRDT